MVWLVTVLSQDDIHTLFQEERRVVTYKFCPHDFFRIDSNTAYTIYNSSNYKNRTYLHRNISKDGIAFSSAHNRATENVLICYSIARNEYELLVWLASAIVCTWEDLGEGLAG
jgi:hypothetical protein